VLLPCNEKMSAMLVSKGFRWDKDVVFRRFEGANHNEAAWRARLEEPLRFLFQ
jgi:enterochelin esterase-like enzyme